MLPALCLLLGSMFYGLQLSAGSFPRPLTRQEEQECLERLAQGDENARNVLIEHNLRLVSHVLKKYYAQSADQEDLVSIGTIGLIKGITTFDSTKGARLATYAARCIENEILMYFRSQRKSSQDVSLSSTVEGSPDGTALTLMDVISDDRDVAEQVANRQMIGQLMQAVDRCLTGQERRVICLRYGLGGSRPLRQREVAECVGISRSYVSRMEKKALEKLREALEH